MKRLELLYLLFPCFCIYYTTDGSLCQYKFT
nr:MAG TPA: hypothetical protein [Caudoviricetes sp.]